MFVLAFQDTDASDNITDTSIPAYNKIVELTAYEKSFLTGDEYLFAVPNSKVVRGTTHVKIIVEINTEEVDTGLRLEANGQITGKLAIQDAQKKIVFKTQYIDPPTYEYGTTYPAYTHMNYNGGLYRMYNTVNAPYKANTGAPDRLVWEYIGDYSPQFDAETSTDNQRVFSIIINTQNSDVVDFITDSDLGTMRIGEQYGEDHNLRIETSGEELMTFYLADGYNNRVGKPERVGGIGYEQLPKGLTLHPNGVISGHPTGERGTYQFGIIAQNGAGLAKQKMFTLEIASGFESRCFSAKLRGNGETDRLWYDMLMQQPFSKIALYRDVDPNYGVQSSLKMLIKNNVDGTFNNTALDIDRSARVATAKLSGFNAFQLRCGNTRIQTALDARGEPLYDLVYKELLPVGATVVYDTNPWARTEANHSNILRLKQELFKSFGSFDLYVETDPTRAIQQEQDGVIYTDDCPLWMSNPDTTRNQEAGYMIALPVAYLMPGEGEKFIATAIEYGVLNQLFFNQVITFSSMELLDFTKEVKNNRIIKFRCD